MGEKNTFIENPLHIYNNVPRNCLYVYVIKDSIVHFIMVVFDMFYYNWSEEYRSL